MKNIFQDAEKEKVGKKTNAAPDLKVKEEKGNQVLVGFAGEVVGWLQIVKLGWCQEKNSQAGRQD